MRVRKAIPENFEGIFLMGSDVWRGDAPLKSYLDDCRNSEKYRLGQWYVLSVEERLVSSLIVYENCFNIPEGWCGMGSVATDSECRRHGYASELVHTVSSELKQAGASGIFLFSDINAEFYEALGFEITKGQSSTETPLCMRLTFQKEEYPQSTVPSYF